ncbi:MAG: aminotransferase class V-fold PLP-dependent enzyme [Gammaproteobacteria bacterium]|nr:aminotransferase class V-fold PLP-dependent enzyme [Gammaproteobacteria bacterium]
MALKPSFSETAFYGLNTHYPLADGRISRRIYLDSSASTLMMKPALEAAQAYLEHYSNTHSTVHTSAHITDYTLRWAQQQILNFVGASTTDYICISQGSGTTGVANRLAAGLATLRPERGVVLVSGMEHHSNDLPHRLHAQQVEHIPLCGAGANSGAVDLQALAALLEKYRQQVNYVAVTGVSNVTGIANPLAEIACLAHAHGAYLVVDAAQMAAHAPLKVSEWDVDFVMLSGHKIYAPGSPGILVARAELLQHMLPREVGGGVVDKVSVHHYDLVDDLVDREHAGTPNIFGTVLLGCVTHILMQYGMEKIRDNEYELHRWACQLLRERCPSIRIYGDSANCERLGSLSFNLRGIEHGLVAAVLNDFFGIAVRNQCFCAHPYVHTMLLDDLIDTDFGDMTPQQLEYYASAHRGMVRASFGLYTQREDVEALADALCQIANNIAEYSDKYRLDDDGGFVLRQPRAKPNELFDIEKILHESTRRFLLTV